MENNVNTLPSKENNRISINWMIFNPKEKEIDAKKLNIGKGAYIPKIENVEKTYIIEKNNVWMRCAKIANKLKRISTVGSEGKIEMFKKRMERVQRERKQRERELKR